mgnify:CR=1 FL=1
MNKSITPSLRRGHDGALRVESRHPLSFDRRAIDVLTHKGHRGLTCSAQCIQLAPDGLTFSFVLYQDWHVLLAAENARGTERALRELHAKGLQRLRELLPAIHQKYGQPEPRPSDYALLLTDPAELERERAAELEFEARVA